MGFLFYERKGLLVNDQASASLTRQEAKCLTALVRSNGDLVSYDMLCSWLSVESHGEGKWDAFIKGYKNAFDRWCPWERDFGEKLVHQLAWRARKKIGAIWADCDPYAVIVTHRGRGLSASGISIALPPPLTSECYVTLPRSTYRLTPNQKKILEAYSHPTQRNFSGRELAKYLGMNYHTFRDHRRKLYKEIGVDCKIDAVVVAMSVYRERREANVI